VHHIYAHETTQKQVQLFHINVASLTVWGGTD